MKLGLRSLKLATVDDFRGRLAFKGHIKTEDLPKFVVFPALPVVKQLRQEQDSRPEFKKLLKEIQEFMPSIDLSCDFTKNNTISSYAEECLRALDGESLFLAEMPIRHEQNQE